MWRLVISLIFVVAVGRSFVGVSTLPIDGRNGAQSRLTVLSTDDWHAANNYYHASNDGPGTHVFAYDVDDPQSGNVQYRSEERFGNGTIVGSYGYLRPDGLVQVVNYVADRFGYRATMETHPSTRRL